LSATAASASALVVFVMQFGITYTLPRFLPTSPYRTELINTTLTIIMVSTIVGSIVFLALPFADKLFALGGGLFCLVFVLGACVQAGEGVFGVVLVADRSSGKVAAANTLPNLIRLAAPAFFVSLGSLGAYLARIIADAFGFVILGIVLARKGHRFRPALSIAATRNLGRFSIGMYIANIVGGLPILLLPIIVLARLGSKQAAYWAIAITISTLLSSLPSVVTQALLPEVSYRPAERRYLMRRSAVLIVALVLPALVVAYIVAPWVLELFGHTYLVNSLVPLHWLIIAGFITMLNYVTGTILIIAKKTLMITVVNAVDAVIVLGMASAWATDVRGVAISWTVGDAANTLLFGLFAILAIRGAGGRLEDLGEERADVPMLAPRISTINDQQQGLQTLLMLAERQRAAALHERHHYNAPQSGRPGTDPAEDRRQDRPGR